MENELTLHKGKIFDEMFSVSATIRRCCPHVCDVVKADFT